MFSFIIKKKQENMLIKEAQDRLFGQEEKVESILNKLQNLSESDFYPYHMPGHKRLGNDIFALDITEIDGFDNLHHATGILKEAQERAANLYGALDSYFLVNGSTCGILAAVSAAFHRGDRVIVARNCHKAVYHALELRGLEPVYLYPEQIAEYDINNRIRPVQVAELLEREDKKAAGMILTSPTYEGYASEIGEIAKILHERDMILIVDEAHGAHFGFHEDFPKSAVGQGADLVIQSLHKTLPSMTQTALLHRCGSRVEKERIQKFLGVYQTSSPSYVFMAYMDECMRLLEREGHELFAEFSLKLRDFYKKCDSLRHIQIVRDYRSDKVLADPGKVVIGAGEFMTGKELYDKLRCEFGLQLEMYAGNYALAIMTVCDSREGFDRLYEALCKIDRDLEETGACTPHKRYERSADTDKVREALALLYRKQPTIKYLSGEVEDLEREKVDLEDCANRISGEYIYLYPPGIPFIVPGECVDEEMLKAMISLRNQGYEVQGMADTEGASLWVVKENDR